MFQITGAADSGAITASLKKAGGEKTELPLDTPLELTESGEHVLTLVVPGFVPISIQLSVSPGEASPGVKAKDNHLPLGCLLTRQRIKETSAGTQSDWLFLLRCTFAHPRELVLVAGVETGLSGTDFDLFAKTRREDQTSAAHKSIEPAADKNTIVTHFSFATGKRSSYMLRSPTQWMVVDEEDHGRPAPREQRPEGLSITHAYDWIIAAGKELPGRVVEFSIYGHAWKQGPILLGTDDVLHDKIKRDPTDHDCRIKDFNGSVMDVQAFAKAFSADAQNHVFGCYGNLLYKWCARVLKNPRPNDPEKKFVVKKKNGSMTKMTWDACYAVVDKALVNHYSYALAVATGCPTWAGTPGAGSSFARKRRRHYCEMDMRAFGVYVEAVAKTFELEHNAQWYVKYVTRIAEVQVGEAANQADANTAQAGTPRAPATGQPPAPQKAEGIEIVEPTADVKQYVNLPPGAHQGRVVRVKAKLTPATSGTDVHWSFEGTSHLGGELHPGEAGFGTVSSMTKTKVTKTDAKGIASVDFCLAPQGGDQFRVIASRSATAPGSSSNTFTVWRKVFYEMDTMKPNPDVPLAKKTSLEHHQKILPLFRKVFVEMKHQGKDQHPPHRANFPCPPGTALNGELSQFGYDYFGGKESPNQVHLVGIDHSATQFGEETVEFKLDNFFGKAPKSYPIYSYEGSKSEHWLKLAEYRDPSKPKKKYGMLVWTEMDKSLFELITDEHGKARISVFLPDAGELKATKETPLLLKLRLRLAKEKVAFQIAGGPNVYFCDGHVRGLLPSDESNRIGMLVHEIAHVLGMVPRDADDASDDLSTGPHCAVGTCVMFHGISSKSTKQFCPSCTKAMLKLDIGGAVGALKFRGKGSKS